MHVTSTCFASIHLRSASLFSLFALVPMPLILIAQMRVVWGLLVVIRWPQKSEVWSRLWVFPFLFLLSFLSRDLGEEVFRFLVLLTGQTPGGNLLFSFRSCSLFSGLFHHLCRLRDHILGHICLSSLLLKFLYSCWCLFYLLWFLTSFIARAWRAWWWLTWFLNWIFWNWWRDFSREHENSVESRQLNKQRKEQKRNRQK